MSREDEKAGVALKILILEDWEPDVKLMVRALEKDGFAVEFRWAASRGDFEQALRVGGMDVILADYRLRDMDGMDALKLATELRSEVPFIVVTGSIDEETAVECMKSGAWDYVIKDHLVRLGAAVRSALARKKSLEEKKRAEEELRRSQRRFRALIENAADLIVVLDRETKIRYVSPPVRALMGYGCQDLLGRSILDFVHPEDSARLRRRFREFVEEENTIRRAMYRFVGADGEAKLLELTAKNLLSNPDVSGVVVNARDVTERKLLEDRFLQAQKMEPLGRLAGAVAHDFNNVLTAVLGNVEMLLMNLEPGSDAHQLAVAIQEAAEAGARVSRQLTAFAKGQVSQPMPTDLRDVVGRMATTLLPVLGEDIRLELRLDDLPCMVHADSGQLEQAVMNLAVNAREAMPEGGHLAISVHKEVRDGSDVVVLSVGDTGRGVPPEIRSRIFDPFFTTKSTGTGLGLYTVRSIVETHGGTVELDSHPGRGTTVQLIFPALPVTSAEEGRRRAPKEYDEIPRGQETVLVVEDEKAVLKFAIRALTTLGYNVLWARDVEDAFRKIELGGREIDVALLDVVLPGPGSAEVTRRLMAQNPTVRIIYMSGYAREKLSVLGSDGTVDFIQKPFTLAQLASKLRKSLDDQPDRVGL